MKKFITILLTICYLLPAVGFSMDLHWCGKSVKIVTINSSHQKKCPCGKKMPSKCCKDVHVSVKITDNQKASAQLSAPQNNFVKQISTCIIALVLTPFSDNCLNDFSCYHAPPFKTKQPAYISNHIFRI